MPVKKFPAAINGARPAKFIRPKNKPKGKVAQSIHLGTKKSPRQKRNREFPIIPENSPYLHRILHRIVIRVRVRPGADVSFYAFRVSSTVITHIPIYNRPPFSFDRPKRGIYFDNQYWFYARLRGCRKIHKSIHHLGTTV